MCNVLCCLFLLLYYPFITNTIVVSVIVWVQVVMALCCYLMMVLNEIQSSLYLHQLLITTKSTTKGVIRQASGQASHFLPSSTDENMLLDVTLSYLLYVCVQE